MITGEKKSFINNQIRIFMNNVDKNMTIFSNGLIYHPIEHLINKRILKKLYINFNNKKNNKEISFI